MLQLCCRLLQQQAETMTPEVHTATFTVMRALGGCAFAPGSYIALKDIQCFTETRRSWTPRQWWSRGDVRYVKKVYTGPGAAVWVEVADSMSSAYTEWARVFKAGAFCDVELDWKTAHRVRSLEMCPTTLLTSFENRNSSRPFKTFTETNRAS